MGELGTGYKAQVERLARESSVHLSPGIDKESLETGNDRMGEESSQSSLGMPSILSLKHQDTQGTRENVEQME